MTTIAINNLCQKFGLTYLVVKSWWDEVSFESEKDAEVFLKKILKW